MEISQRKVSALAQAQGVSEREARWHLERREETREREEMQALADDPATLRLAEMFS